MQEAPTHLCRALGRRLPLEDLMIFCGLKFHSPGRTLAGVSTSELAAGSGRRPGALVVCSILGFPSGGRTLVCTLYREKGAANPSRRMEGQGLRVATSLCSCHPGLPFFCVTLIFLASWTNYGPFSIPVYESVSGKSTNATM